jgi:hypothetical protein
VQKTEIGRSKTQTKRSNVSLTVFLFKHTTPTPRNGCQWNGAVLQSD